jgi:hypothetical protein
MSARHPLHEQARQALQGAPMRQARQQVQDWRMRHGLTPADAPVVSVRHLPALLARLALSAGPSLAVVWALQPQILLGWQALIGLWCDALGLPLQLQLQLQPQGLAGGGWWQLVGASPDDGTALPSMQSMAWTSLVCALLWWGSARWPDRWLPLRVLVRALVGVQLAALVFVVLLPSHFPYTLSSHLSTLLNLGYGFMAVVPVLLALGWGLLTLPLWQRLLVPLLLLAYLAVLLPHKALLQVWLLAHSSVVHMPVFYVALGPLLDLMVFIALYGWLLSLRPPAVSSALSP